MFYIRLIIPRENNNIIDIDVVKLANLLLQDVVDGSLEDTGRFLEAEWKTLELKLSIVHRETVFSRSRSVSMIWW